MNALTRLARPFVCTALLLTSLCAMAQAVVDGEVKKVDRRQARISIKHGEVAQFDMPPLTGAYRVQDPAMLDQVDVGDRVTFHLDRIDSVYLITKIDKR